MGIGYTFISPLLSIQHYLDSVCTKVQSFGLRERQALACDFALPSGKICHTSGLQTRGSGY